MRNSLSTLVAVWMAGCAFDSTFFVLDKERSEVAYPNHETFSLVAADGSSIDHLWIRPQREPKATVLVFHGSGSTASRWSSSLKPLVDDRYQVFLMEYRGFGRSQGSPTHHSVLADANRALLHVSGLEDVRTRKLLLFGQSYGGQLAIGVTARHPDSVDALVTEGAFTSFKDIAVHSTPLIVRPFTWLIFRNPYRSTRLISNLALPKLFIHSRDDEVVPFSMGRELYESASGTKEFWAIRGEHTDALADYPAEFVRRVNAMLEL